MSEISKSSKIDPEVEARIVALELGEASEFEAEQLARLIAGDPDLAAFQQKIRTTHSLLSAVGEGDFLVDDDWQLPPDRRESVLATLEGRQPSPFVHKLQKPWRRTVTQRLSWAAAACCVLVCLGSVFLVFLQQRYTSTAQAPTLLGIQKSAPRREKRIDEVDYNYPRSTARTSGGSLSNDSNSASQDLYLLKQPALATEPRFDPKSTNKALLELQDNAWADLDDESRDTTLGFPIRIADDFGVDATPNPEVSNGREVRFQTEVSESDVKTPDVSAKSRGTVLMVTPRILVGKEEEEKQLESFGLGRTSQRKDDRGEPEEIERGGRDMMGGMGGGMMGGMGGGGGFGGQQYAEDFIKADSPGEETLDLGRSGRKKKGFFGAVPDKASFRHEAKGASFGNRTPAWGLSTQDQDSDGLASEGIEFRSTTSSDFFRNSSRTRSADTAAPAPDQSIRQGLESPNKNSQRQVQEFVRENQPTAGESLFDMEGQMPPENASIVSSEKVRLNERIPPSSPSQSSTGSTEWDELVRKRDAREQSNLEPEKVMMFEAPQISIQYALKEYSVRSEDKLAGIADKQEIPDGEKRLSGPNVRFFSDNGIISRQQIIQGVSKGQQREKDQRFGRRYRMKQRTSNVELDEVSALREPFSTFSLHVSDVSFKLCRNLLSKGDWPSPERVRIEEFVNAFDYGDPLPSPSERVSCQLEQAVHPFLQQRNLMRIALRTAATGRATSTPLRLTFLLDNSGSMQRADRQATVRRAFGLLAKQLRPQDQATLICFSRRPRLLADKVQGDKVENLVELIANLPSEGGTNLENALETAYQKAREQFSNEAQNRVILLTDGAVNLGDADPNSLAKIATTMRGNGIAFDAAGIIADGLNDDVLEALTRQGDGRYYLLDSIDSADEGFVQQVAGALRPSAKNVKVQIQFNPNRVGNYKLFGFEKHRLEKKDFRNDQVDAAEMTAAEAGVAVYQFEAKPNGQGDIGTVSVRFRDLVSNQMVERSWPIPYQPNPPRLDQASSSLRLASTAALFGAKLRGQSMGETVSLSELSKLLSLTAPNGTRHEELRQMIQQAREIVGE